MVFFRVLTAAALSQLTYGQDFFLAQRDNETDDLASEVDAGRRRRRHGKSGSCNSFKKHSDNCRSGWSPQGHCGQCMNAGARPGVACKGAKHTGYYCPVDDPPAGADMAFACLDWSFGSNAMRSAEATFKARTGHNVYFGVGSYGTYGIPMNGLGACFRVKASGVSRELILQSINSGHDVSSGQFDLQMGDGGAGKFNACAGGSKPGHNTMFPGSKSSWGRTYGGVDRRSQCKQLPSYPAKDAAMKAAGDDLVSLCEYGFDHHLRYEGGGNPHIKHIARVKCPSELVHMTQILRKDDPSSYEVQESLPLSLDADANSTTGCKNCLTRMMDCRKPSAGIKDNIRPELMQAGHKLVQPCLSDGYTRIDVQCGCFDCYC